VFSLCPLGSSEGRARVQEEHKLATKTTGFRSPSAFSQRPDHARKDSWTGTPTTQQALVAQLALIFAVLLVAPALSVDVGSDGSILPGANSWGSSLNANTANVNEGDIVFFQWTSGPHNVVEMKDQPSWTSCSFVSSNALVSAASSKSFQFDTTGLCVQCERSLCRWRQDYAEYRSFFGVNIGPHCAVSDVLCDQVQDQAQNAFRVERKKEEVYVKCAW